MVFRPVNFRTRREAGLFQTVLQVATGCVSEQIATLLNCLAHINPNSELRDSTSLDLRAGSL